MNSYMQLAIAKAEEGQTPFGAVIVRQGEVLAAVFNTVKPSNDPTAHAEVNAIREACKRISRTKVEGAQLFTTCEPCPMCAAAASFAGLQDIYYGATIPTISQYLPQIHLRAGEVLKQADTAVSVRQMEKYADACEELLRQFS